MYKRQIVACATHPVLSGPAIDRINETKALSQVIVTDTIPLGDKLERCPKLKVCLLYTSPATGMLSWACSAGIPSNF